MRNKRENFNRAAANAVNAGIAAQAELATRLAREIISDPARFDPKSLRSLDSNGLRVLLAGVRQHDVNVAANAHYERPEHLDARAQASSWRHLRKPEPYRWLRALATGAVCGLVIEVLGLAVAIFT
jgi:hypothetical protein